MISIKKKKILLIIFLVLIEVSTVFLMIKSYSNKGNVTEEEKEEQINNKLAILIENEEGKYVKYDGSKWPTKYIYNEDESKCLDVNGERIENSLTYNSNKSKVYVTSSKETYCYLYFDKPIEDKTYKNPGCEIYTARSTGYYQIELWGASGGNKNGKGGKGGYTKGIIYLKKGEQIEVCVGGSGESNKTYAKGGFNGGGNSGQNSTWTGAGGGGATDVRLVKSSWNDTEGLNSRIMVAAGGGGAYDTGGNGGGLIGIGVNENGRTPTTGGTQKSGGNCENCNTYAGFGVGASSKTEYDAGGGGAGYYGGGAGNDTIGGAGGSSFISGYAGVNAITSSTDRTHTNNTLHYSNKYFISGVMKSGVNDKDGEALIKYVGYSKPERIYERLDKVRYIKDCVNGNNSDNINRWNEIQAIYNGENIAKGKTVTMESGSIGKSYYVTDGDIGEAGGTDGYSYSSCVIIDLGNEYDLDEVAVWHNWHDNYKDTKDNYTYVSRDKSNWTVVIDEQTPETSEGKRVNAYEVDLAASIKATKKSSGTSVSSGVWSNEGLNYQLSLTKASLNDYEIYYCKDTSDTCEPKTKVSSGAQITSYNGITGTYYIRYRVKNSLNMYSDIGSYKAMVDTVIPSVSISATKSSSKTSVSSGVWSSEGLNFKLTKGTTGLSGYTIYYCYDTNDTCDPTTKVNSGTQITSYNGITGTYYIRYKIVSGAGSSSSVGSYKAMVDKVRPTVSISATKVSAKTSISSGVWSNQGLNFKLNAGTTGLSGYTIYYCKDTSNTCDPTTKVNNDTQITSYNGITGIYYIRYKIVSGAKLSSSVGSFKAMVDTTKPSAPTVALVNGSWSEKSNNTWYNFDIYVSGKANSSDPTPSSTDSQSGIAKYQISTDNSTWYDWSYNASSSIYHINWEGTTYRYIRAIDNAGNISNVTTKTIKIDKSGPSVPTLTNSSGGSWTNSNVTLTASSTDTKSGINRIEYSYDNSTWYTDWTYSNITNGKKASGTWSAERNNTVYVRAVDNVGNVSGVSTTTVRIDKSAPSTPTLTNSSGGSWTNSNVTLTASSTDTKSGINRIEYSYDNSTWYTDWTYSNITNGKKASGTWSAERNNTVYIRALDNVGNVSGVASTTVKIDKTAPSCSLSASSSGVYFASKSDSLSGIQSYGLSKSSSATYNWTTSLGLSNGYFYGYVKDYAGNTNYCTRYIFSTTYHSIPYCDGNGWEMCGSGYNCQCYYYIGSATYVPSYCESGYYDCGSGVSTNIYAKNTCHHYYSTNAKCGTYCSGTCFWGPSYGYSKSAYICSTTYTGTWKCTSYGGNYYYCKNGSKYNYGCYYYKNYSYNNYYDCDGKGNKLNNSYCYS